AVGRGTQVLRGPRRDHEVVGTVALGTDRRMPDPAFKRHLLPGALAPAEDERRALLDRREDGAVRRRAQLFTAPGDRSRLCERCSGPKEERDEAEKAKHPGNRLEAIRLFCGLGT